MRAARSWRRLGDFPALRPAERPGLFPICSPAISPLLGTARGHLAVIPIVRDARMPVMRGVAGYGIVRPLIFFSPGAKRGWCGRVRQKSARATPARFGRGGAG